MVDKRDIERVLTTSPKPYLSCAEIAEELNVPVEHVSHQLWQMTKGRRVTRISIRGKFAYRMKDDKEEVTIQLDKSVWRQQYAR